MKFFNLSEWAVSHRPFVLFLIIAIFVSGIYSFIKLGRLEDPHISIPTMSLVVFWPGATAEEIQEQVADRIEKEVHKVAYFDNIRTFSRQGYAAMQIWLKDSTPPSIYKDLWYQVRKRVSDIRHEFPPGVQGPYFNDDYSSAVYSMIYVISGKDYSFADLNRHAENIRKQLVRVPMVNKVDIIGKQQEKIFIEFSHRKLVTLGISPKLIFESLQKQNVITPAGFVETGNDRVFVRVEGSFESIESIKAVPIETNGRLVRLSDIAKVYHGYEDPPSYTARYNAKPVVAIGVTINDDGNIIKLGENLKQVMDMIKAELPAGLELDQIADQPKVVEDSISEFLKTFLEALIIVLAVSFFSLGWRTGIVVAVSVPVVLSIVVIVMYFAGMNLERISLGSLIIALGLLVDDAIIAVEMMMVKMEQGLDRIKAATFAFTSTAFPMLTGTIVTTAGFLPIGFCKSTGGEYAGGIFWVVGIALIASWFVAVIFTPYLGYQLLPDFKKSGKISHNPYDRPVYHRLKILVEWCVVHRRAVVAVTFFVFLAACAGMTLVQKQFFPMSSRPEVLVELRMKEGSSFEATTAEVKKLEQILSKDPDISYFSAYTGAGAPRFYLSFCPELPNPAYAQFIIMTRGIKERERVTSYLTGLFEKGRLFPNAMGRVLRIEFGPPVGFPVQFRVIGKNRQKVRDLSYRVSEIMRKCSYVRDVQLDWDPMVRSVKIKIDQDHARLLGLTPQDIAGVTQTVLSGYPVTQFRNGTELIDIVARAVPEERKNLDSLNSISIATANASGVPLSQVGLISYELEEPVIWRRNGEVTITVRSDVVNGVQGPWVTKRIWPTLKPVIDKLPYGYRIEKGGAIEENEKANKAVFDLFPAMLLIMLFFLMMQLQNFSKMLLVFSTAPLGIIGVVPAMLAFNSPFGFVALLGVIALSGIIMRNSVILVDQIERDIKDGSTPWNAIVDATIRRSRPVVLTAAATVLAMIPLMSSTFWGPMAIAIMGGLIVATALTLLFLPAVYALSYHVKRA